MCFIINTKFYYDKNAKDLCKLSPGSTVRIRQGDKKEWSTKCKVVSNTTFPRSYVVETPRGNHLRRNRKDLLLTSEKFDVETDVDVDPSPPVAVSEELPTQQRAVEKHYVTRSGRVSKPPSRYVP